MSEYRTFGGVTVVTEERVHGFSGRQAAVVAVLLAAHPETLSASRLIDEVWGDELPADPEAALHTAVSRIRSIVGDDLQRVGPGYRLETDSIDIVEYEAAARKARQTSRVSDFEEAERLWRGQPFAGYEDLPTVGLAIEALNSLRGQLTLEHIDKLIETGAAAAAADEAKRLVETDGFDERSLGLYMRGLYGSGRKPEALAVFRDYEQRMSSKGLEPSADIRELELAILLDEFERPKRTSRPSVTLDLSISYVDRASGEQIAVGRAGEGSPIFVHPGWLSRLDHIAVGNDFRAPLWAELARRHEITIFDRYGTGLSGGDPGDFSFRTNVEEVKQVLRATGDGPVPVWASSGGGPICIQAAAEAPELFSHLLLYATYASGPATFPRRVADSILALYSASWGMGSELMANLLFPAASAEHRASWASVQNELATREVAVGFLSDTYTADVSDLLPELRLPCLIIHYQGDKAIPYRAAEEMARHIPKSRLMPLDGVTHYPLPGDEIRVADAVDRFLAVAG